MNNIKKFCCYLLFIAFFSCQNDSEVETETNEPPFASGLTFQNLIDIPPTNYYVDQMVGFLANESNNSLYISSRSQNLLQSETIRKLNLNNLNLTTKNTTSADFATKRNHIYNNKLYVFGGDYYNRYDLDLNEDLIGTSYSEQRSFTRQGTCIQDNNLYIIGGFLGGIVIPNYDKKILKLNLASDAIEEVATMQKNRWGASAELVNNKIYTFFGSEVLSLPEEGYILHNDIQIYDLTTNTFQNIAIENNIYRSFTAKYHNYIFVAGTKVMNSSEGNVTPIDSYFGYFDTTTNTLHEIEIFTENNTYSFPYICEIEIMNNKIYALMRNSENNYSVQVANLN
jgi:hypothetical protein